MLKIWAWIDLLLLRISSSFQVKFWRPSDRSSNSQINYRHHLEWEEPKQNGGLVPVIKPSHFWEIKGKYSLSFASVCAFKRDAGAYGGIRSSSLMDVVWMTPMCQMLWNSLVLFCLSDFDCTGLVWYLFTASWHSLNWRFKCRFNYTNKDTFSKLEWLAIFLIFVSNVIKLGISSYLWPLKLSVMVEHLLYIAIIGLLTCFTLQEH